ncbi:MULTISPECIES: helix-turn-helix domain-containing protein [Streptomyces]|jgi:predicted DNA-binding transcriptional regulator AlpA|uniref:helix-turn-helix domain-containing protein n=1 Tax=Streptomyces TaxID=1883 RepID=UPI0005615A1F|nr:MULTISPECIES: helix-turn-helix domain-containing protein [Streptomyces]WSQ21802.1 helix-turn-helix domain-containing protein [Streptomyces zaomyceticus]
MSHGSPLLTTKQLASYLNKPVATIHSWRRRRVGPPGFRLGRDVVYRMSAVDAWLKGLEDADRISAGERGVA